MEPSNSPGPRATVRQLVIVSKTLAANGRSGASVDEGAIIPLFKNTKLRILNNKRCGGCDVADD